MLTSGCQLVGGYADFDYGTSAEQPDHACDVLPSAKDDDRGLSAMARIDRPDQTCFWMDRTEVTVDQYESWQEDVPANGIEWDPTWCDWKGDRSDPMGAAGDACVAEIPPLDVQPFAPKKPMRCVDFCEAEAYCRWAKKRLCHDSSAFGTQGPRVFPREWVQTCSNQSTTVYPWGNDAADYCNTGQMPPDDCISTTGNCGAAPVGQMTNCSTPGGVMDLTGNVAEWVYSCNHFDSSASLEPTGCLTRGGGYDAPLQACDHERTIPNDSREPALGFRCCTDLAPDEEALVDATRR